MMNQCRLVKNILIQRKASLKAKPSLTTKYQSRDYELILLRQKISIIDQSTLKLIYQGWTRVSKNWMIAFNVSLNDQSRMNPSMQVWIQANKVWMRANKGWMRANKGWMRALKVSGNDQLRLNLRMQVWI